ncbi:MAG: hypothetical protein V4584_16200 [Verrucomicrobiota bacterium]
MKITTPATINASKVDPAINMSRICRFSPRAERDVCDCCSQEGFSAPPCGLPRRRFFKTGCWAVGTGSSATTLRTAAISGGGVSVAAGILRIRRQLGQTMPLPS